MEIEDIYTIDLKHLNCSDFVRGGCMYAVLATGGKQYKVEKGAVLRIESLDIEVGSEVNFDNVLMFSDGVIVEVGQPKIKGMIVRGRVIAHGRNKKIIVFKYKRRKRYRRKQGHRQCYTSVMIDSISKI